MVKYTIADNVSFRKTYLKKAKVPRRQRPGQPVSQVLMLGLPGSLLRCAAIISE